MRISQYVYYKEYIYPFKVYIRWHLTLKRRNKLGKILLFPQGSVPLISTELETNSCGKLQHNIDNSNRQ